jgi:transcription elongation factor GreA
MTSNSQPPLLNGRDLLLAVGLSVEGPVLWGRPVVGSSPGVFIVELPAPQPKVSIDPNAIRDWLGRAPDLRVDGKQPSVAELQSHMASFWVASQQILYVGSSQKSVAARVAGMYKTPLGERRPQPSGYWLKTLHDLGKCRIWWAPAPDPDLYEDMLLEAFMKAAGSLPYAVLATPSGEHREHGLTGALHEDVSARPAKTTRVTVLPDANEEEMALSSGPDRGRGARTTPSARPSSAARVATSTSVAATASAEQGDPSADPEAPVTNAQAEPAAQPARRARVASTRAPARTSASKAPSRAAARRAAALAPQTGPSAIVPVVIRRSSKAEAKGGAVSATHITAEGLIALENELEELTTLRRPEVIARIKSARELGDLSENADYEAARKEQSFLEGRILQIEQMIKYAQIIDTTGETGSTVVMGSTVVVETDRHGEETFTIVGSAEADASAGKISFTSPIGKALIGHRAGEMVRVTVPAGTMDFKVVEVK